MSRFLKVLLLIFVTTSILSGCGGADERKNAYLEKAKQSIAAGDLDKARIELKNVLQIDPKFGNAYYQLGKIYEAKHEYRQAFGSYSKAAELTPDNFKNQARLGRFYLILAGDKTKAEEKMKYILGKAPENIDGLLLKAAILMRENKTDESLKISEGITKRAPYNVENSTFLALLYWQQKKPEKTIAVLEKTLEKNRDNVQLNLLLAKALINTKKYDSAEKIYQNFLKNKPDDFKSYTNLAGLYNLKGDKKKAVSILKQAIENNPDEVDRQLTLVQYIQQTQGKDAAEAELISLINQHSSLGKLRLALGELYNKEGKTQQAKAVYKKAVTEFSEDATGIQSRIMLALMYMHEKKEDKAKKELQDAIAISPNNPKVNMLIARIAIHDKNYEKVILSLRIVVKETPGNAEAYILLAAAHSVLGEKEQADTVLNNAYENNRDNPNTLMQLAKYYTKVNDIDKTEKMIDAYLALNDKSYEALSIKAKILNKEKKFSKVRPFLQKLITLFPTKENGYLLSMPYLANEKNSEKAVSLLKQGYKKVANKQVILQLLTSIQLSMGDKKEALNRINTAIKNSPDNINLQLLLAKTYLSIGDYKRAEVELKEVVQSHPDSEEAYVLLSGIYNKQNNQAARADIIRQGSEKTGSVRMSIMLAGIYGSNKKYDKAISIYEHTLSKSPDNALVMNNLASILSDHKTDKASLNRAKQLADKMKKSTQPVIQDTVGWIYYKTGDYTAAIKILKNSVKKAPDINIFNYHLGMAYKAAGDNKMAKTYLQKSLSNNKKFDGRTKAEQVLKTL